MPPTDCTDFHRLGEYGIPAIPTQPIAHPNFCGFREFRGRFFSASNSVRSVDSVGKPTQPNHLCRVKSVGEHEYSHRIRRIQNNSKANNATIYDFEIRRNRHRRWTRRMRGGSSRSTHGRKDMPRDDGHEQTGADELQPRRRRNSKRTDSARD